ncbi:MAG: potassium channel protein [Acidobacteria bacterium]|nr:potassium channel protein [Acidobacteriota bacterium]
MSQKGIYFSLTALFGIVLLGVLGYHLLEGWSLFDSLYMTVITLATIGYGETHPLTFGGRVFTIILIALGVTAAGFIFTTLTRVLVETQITAAFGRRKLFRDINKLKNHYIICGAGRVGMRIVDEFKKKSVDFVVIERDPGIADRLLAQGELVLIGDATDEAVLDGANVKNARSLIAAASSDAENVYIALSARGINPDLYIVARANDQSGERQMRRAGVNKVVSPALIGSHRMAQAAMSPAVADFIELTTMTEGLDLLFEQVRIEPGSILAKKQIKDSGIRTEHNVMIVAITDHLGRMQFNPDGNQELNLGDLLIAIGTRAGVKNLERLANYERGESG